VLLWASARHLAALAFGRSELRRLAAFGLAAVWQLAVGGRGAGLWGAGLPNPSAGRQLASFGLAAAFGRATVWQLAAV